MRTLKKALARAEDSCLRAGLFAFCRQEGEDGLAHRHYWENRRTLGYCFDELVKALGFVLFRVIEPLLPPKVHPV